MQANLITDANCLEWMHLLPKRLFKGFRRLQYEKKTTAAGLALPIQASS